MAHLVLDRLTKRFGGLAAVADVDLEIGAGEYWVLLGPSGCGKTTLLRMIAGHETPTDGRILLDDRPITHVPPARRDILTVFQHFALFPHMSVRENLAFGLRMRGVTKSEWAGRIDPMLRLVGLTELAERKPKALSGGQMQRVALARALIVEPAILLLDEPFGDLDRKLELEMRGDVRQIQRRLGQTFIHVTHNQEEALAIADRIVVMDDGAVQQVASPHELFERPANRFVAAFMGESNLLDVRVEGREAGCYVTVDEHGNRFTVRSANEEGDPNFAAGEPATLCLRASRAGLGTGNGTNAIAGTVALAEYLGARVKLYIERSDGPGGRFHITVDDREFFGRGLGEGAEIRVTWQPDDLRLLRG